MGNFPTYAFEGDKVIAFHGNREIASGDNFEKVSCSAEEYFETLRNTHKDKQAETARNAATHITTPNGDKGVVLGRTAGLWTDEITVRFDNGQIRRYPTYAGDGLRYSTEDPEALKSPVESLQHQLDEIAEPTREGLTARLNVLDEVRHRVARLVSAGVSDNDAQQLHQIRLTADAEHREVNEALEFLAASDIEALAPPSSAYSAVEQADLGRSDSWLDVVASEMIAESEAQDFDKLLAEGPTLLTSSLDNAVVADGGLTREMAIEHIQAKTAGFQGEAVEQYREQFVAATEMARRQELAYRQDVTKETAEAKTLQDVPDDALFL